MDVRALLAFCLLLIAGCSQPSDDGPASSTSTTQTSSTCTTALVNGCTCPPDTHGYACYTVESWSIEVTGDAGMTVAVPFPHGSQCLSKFDWESAKVIADHAQVSWRTVDSEGVTGDVMWVVLDEDGSAYAWLNTTAKPECQTFRYDPWSIEPDPSDGNLTLLLAGGSGDVKVRYTWHPGEYCSTLTTVHATLAQPGWTTRPIDPEWSGTVCT